MRARTALVVIALVVGSLVASAIPAKALFHLMKVREVYAGQVTETEADFVELQMYSASQVVLDGHILKFYDVAGGVMDCEIPQNIANGNNQETVLFATSQAQTALGVTADFTIPAGMLHADGGAVCFEGIDCVAWGSFSGQTTHPYGTPESGIPLGQSIDRRTDISGDGGLQDQDDTNDSANDFEAEAPSADPNGPVGVNKGTTPCQPGTATGTGGGGGGGVSVSNLKVKTPGNKAVVSGRIEPPAPGDKVALTLYANGSPMRKVSKGKDILDADSEFRKKLPFPSGSTRCKVIIKFKGKQEAKQTFAC